VKKHSARRVEHSLRPGIVLDAGALRALESRHVELAVALLTAHRLDLPIRIPAAALAQVWRGGPRSASLARLLKQPATVVLTDELAARQIGEFIAHQQPGSAGADVVDAHVALTTRATRSLVYTSDPGDMARWGVPKEQIRRI
jgi:hypothetical protein